QDSVLFLPQSLPLTVFHQQLPDKYSPAENAHDVALLNEIQHYRCVLLIAGNCMLSLVCTVYPAEWYNPGSFRLYSHSAIKRLTYLHIDPVRGNKNGLNYPFLPFA